MCVDDPVQVHLCNHASLKVGRMIRNQDFATLLDLLGIQDRFPSCTYTVTATVNDIL